MPRSIPLVSWILAVYGGGSLATGVGAAPWYQMRIQRISLISGDTLHISLGELFLAISLVLLVVDLVRSYSVRGVSMRKLVWSLLLFVGSVVLFLTIPGFGNPDFLIYTLIVLCDLTAGVVMLANARRDPLYLPRDERD